MTDRVIQRIWLAAALALTAIKLWFTRGQGVYAIGSAGLDDRLFIELAQHLIRGEWLGPYSVLTLAKGPAYPLFIAASFFTGLPLFLSQHLVYAVACFAIVCALRPAIKSAAWRFGIYALLLCNPMTFDAPGMGRVLRQHIYGPLVLLIFSGLIALYFRRKESVRRLWRWTTLLGLAAGFFYLTREEGVWLFPSIALLAGSCLFMAWRESRDCLRRMATQLGFSFIIACVPVLTVSALNKHYYGWFGTCEFRASEFKDAYGAMLRVRVGPHLPFVPVTREARVAMAEVSPAFAEVQAQFDRGLARTWADMSSFFTQQPAEAEQIGGGWYMWALREAVSNAGHTDDAAVALAFYQRLADEINAACDDGRLPAGKPRSGFMPIWQDGDTDRFLLSIRDFTDFVIRFRHFGAKPPPSTGSPEELQLFRDITRERLQPPTGELDVVGAKRYLNNLWKVDTLQSVGQSLRFILLGLFCVAQTLALISLFFAIRYRRWSYALTLAAAAWGACAASILIHAIIQATSFPVRSVTSFAPIYPLLLVFVFAAFWDAVLLWGKRRLFFKPSVSPTNVAPAPIPEIDTSGAPKLAPLLLGIGPLIPFVIWLSEFKKLVWFGDDFFLLDQLAAMGMRDWITRVFAENFVPLFKLLWGPAVLAFNGSYLAMLGLLWLTHAVNTTLLARWMQRAGFATWTTIAASIVFALTPANIETLGWSVQWSAVLATSFLLLALWWFEIHRDASSRWSWKLVTPLVLFSAASACSFSRGVLTGGVIAAAFVLPVLLSRRWFELKSRLAMAALCLAPAVAAALVIKSASSGNHQHLAGHWGDILEFGASYFLLNPAFVWLTSGPTGPTGLILLAASKIAVLVFGLRCSRGRMRQALWLLLIFDLGNALLVGVGRYHTGFLAALSSRYQYSSLIATLPFFAAIFEAGLQQIKSAPIRLRVATAIAAILMIWCLIGWPAELRDFTAWRGTEMRAMLAAPATNDPNALVPGMEHLHVERAKALQRTFNLH